MANKSSINIDLDDPRAGKIAKVMSSKTAKAILDLLAEKEMSGSEIAEKLDIPLNTATYNLKKLVDAGLVGKCNRFFWSSKGKRMDLYKVLNKRIVIYPKSMSNKIIAGILGICAIFVVAMILFSAQRGPFVIPGEADTFEGVMQFSSYSELKNYLEENINDDMFSSLQKGFNEEGVVRSFATTDSVAPSVSGGEVAVDDGAGTYSETNIQVEGVDEPDVVKNDGKYIYVVEGKKVFVVDAYPAEEMRILEELEFDDYVSNIFVSEDKLIVFENEYEYFDTGIPCGEFFSVGRCGGYSKEWTNVYVYDMSDRENLELDEKIQFDGNFNNARMVGDFVYVVTTKYISLNQFDLPVHVFGGVEKEISSGEVNYFGSSGNSYVFTTIAAIEVDSQKVELETFLMDASHNMYMSEENIYLTYQKRLSQRYYFEKFVEDVLLEILPSDVAREIEDVMSSDDSHSEKMENIGRIFEEYFEDLEGDDLETFLKEYQDLSEEFYEEVAKEKEATIIHKINVDDFDIDYVVQGEVEGRVLNQFSMDEFNGNFRIATTTGGWNRDNNLNHLYVLDGDLEIVGSVEDLAEGERIYSARFMGERAFMVTFRQVDPLFAIDLSDPENPVVEGELKVTGYSGYLHPVGENHLLGIGMEATEEGRTEGVKISLFDVSDMNNPVEISKYEITEGSYSHSEALYEHKAVLFDKEKELLVIPVNYNLEVFDESAKYPRYEYWQGAFVFDVNLVEGIKYKGKIAHKSNEVHDSVYGYVRRSLYMDDVLYTISNLKVKASDLNSLVDINEVEISEGYPRILYEMDVGSEVAIDFDY